MNTKKHTLWFALSVLMVAAMVLGACAPAAAPAPTQPPAVTAAAASTQAAAGTGSFLDRAMAGEFKGKTVTATGPFVDQDAQKFNATMKDFQDKTGITIQYQSRIVAMSFCEPRS